MVSKAISHNSTLATSLAGRGYHLKTCRRLFKGPLTDCLVLREHLGDEGCPLVRRLLETPRCAASWLARPCTMPGLTSLRIVLFLCVVDCLGNSSSGMGSSKSVLLEECCSMTSCRVNLSRDNFDQTKGVARGRLPDRLHRFTQLCENRLHNGLGFTV